MSDKKEFTPVEFAKKILEGVHNQLKKHEELLAKSKNSAHEIDAGEEPNNDDAECPPMLAEGVKTEGAPTNNSASVEKDESEAPKKKKKQASESPEMEDEPLQGDTSEEADEEEYEFKKSEDEKKNPSFKISKRPEDKEQTDAQVKMINRDKPGKIPSSRKDQLHYEAQAAERRKKMREQGLLKEEAKETKGILFDKPSKSDKTKEEEKGVKRPLEKCGEMKKEEHDKVEKCGEMPKAKGVDKLKKYLHKK
jgi:hypothetical protein